MLAMLKNKKGGLVGIDNNWIFDILLGLMTGGLFFLLNRLVPAFAIGVPTSLVPLTASASAKFIVIIILAPIFEEVFFRDFVLGVLINRLENAIGRPFAILFSLIVQGVLFSLFHLTAYGGSLKAVQGTFIGAAVVGVLFGVLRLLTKSNIGNIIAHAIFNSVLVATFAVVLGV